MAAIFDGVKALPRFVLAVGLIVTVGVAAVLGTSKVTNSGGGDCGTVFSSTARYQVENKAGVTVPVGGDLCASAISDKRTQVEIVAGILLLLTLVATGFVASATKHEPTRVEAAST